MWGLRISWGNGEAKSVGRRVWRIRRAGKATELVFFITIWGHQQTHSCLISESSHLAEHLDFWSQVSQELYEAGMNLWTILLGRPPDPDVLEQGNDMAQVWYSGVCRRWFSTTEIAKAEHIAEGVGGLTEKSSSLGYWSPQLVVRHESWVSDWVIREVQCQFNIEATCTWPAMTSKKVPSNLCSHNYIIIITNSIIIINYNYQLYN